MTIYSLSVLLSNLESGYCSMSDSNCCFLTCVQISQEAGKVSGIPFPPQFVMIHRVKGFGIVNKAEVDIFLELSCFFDDPTDVGNLISDSSAFCKSTWKLMVHILLKPGLENCDHYIARMWGECNWVVLWTFFGIIFLGIEMKTDLYQSCGHCCVFQIWWHIEYST